MYPGIEKSHVDQILTFLEQVLFPYIKENTGCHEHKENLTKIDELKYNLDSFKQDSTGELIK